MGLGVGIGSSMLDSLTRSTCLREAFGVCGATWAVDGPGGISRLKTAVVNRAHRI